MRNASEIRVWVENNHAVGVWVAHITRNGHEVSVIVDSNREEVVAQANRMMKTYQAVAA